MLLGYTHIEGTVRKSLERRANTSAIGHRCGQGDDLLVLLHQFCQCVSKHRRIGRSARFRLDGFAALQVERTSGMPTILSLRMTFALGC